MLTIITATEDEIDRILEIEHEAISPPWTHGSLLNEIYKEDSFFIVVVDKTGEPPPCLMGFAILRHVGDDGELLQIAVDGSARRRGAGDLLMKAVLDYAKRTALKSVFLEVRKGNLAAVCLYRKHGFEAIRVRKGYYDDPVEDALIMVRDAGS